MKKLALVFALAVVAPSLVLAWLALRSVRDQEYLLERQQSLLYQAVSDRKAAEAQAILADCQREFVTAVQSVVTTQNVARAAARFDETFPGQWPLAQVAFAVTLSGDWLSPAPHARPEARSFYEANGRFLANRETAEVYLARQFANNAIIANQQALLPGAQMPAAVENDTRFNQLRASERNVTPQQVMAQGKGSTETVQPSRIAASETEFRHLIGQDTEGALARFVDNKLNVLFWHRPVAAPEFVLGAQLAMPRFIDRLQTIVGGLESELQKEICVAILDDTARPVALSQPGFSAPWKRPFVATEIGEALPHWEIGVYLRNPSQLSQSALNARLALGSLIGLLLLVIAVGSWLIVSNVNRELALARQKTDFVSNVSHELKTPLTSIRMFSELLAEGRVADPGKQRSYLNIIAAETARLTRLINNVLDFARSERGEKTFKFQPCNLAEVVRETADSYRPHLEANGFKFECRLPENAVTVRGDRDALAQVLVNLVSNAEKYSADIKDITLELRGQELPLPHAEVWIKDRGLGVPRGCEKKIFEQFFRAHDSLGSGIQGSGLGLTLARQIARAHGGEIAHEHREGGGSCFVLRLPLNGSTLTQ